MNEHEPIFPPDADEGEIAYHASRMGLSAGAGPNIGLDRSADGVGYKLPSAAWSMHDDLTILGDTALEERPSLWLWLALCVLGFAIGILLAVFVAVPLYTAWLNEVIR